MGKEFSNFVKTEVEKNKLYHHKTLIFLKDVDIEKLLISSKISLGRKSTLLVTCLIIIKLIHYKKCFQKQTLM